MCQWLEDHHTHIPEAEHLPESTERLDPRDRQILRCYRLSAHNLAMESGHHRQKYMPRESRLCQQNQEDEVHLMRHCSKYSAVRDTHFRRLSDLHLDFSSIKEGEKIHPAGGRGDHNGHSRTICDTVD
ncbi:hypothetical protein GDO81_026402 [Engystomops pustulosus]|uniref:Uncharacterized protein n=1 Tax=Engystomops pustulosus TaxID=76066 RepID=A0AAV6YMB5_ENGPU|nr:hypothetical protein GDO81_026402 [Engystomops pustulosus]